MSEYHFPVPASKIKNDIRRLINLKVVFTYEDAIMDIMIMMDTGKIVSERRLATRWRWNKSRVHRSLSDIRTKVQEWRSFGKLTSEPEVNQNEPKVNHSRTTLEPENGVPDMFNGHSEPHLNHSRTRSEPEVNQPVLIYPRATDTDTYKHINKDTIVSSHLDSSKVTMSGKEIMESWNDFAKKHGLQTIRDLTPKRTNWIRLRKKKIIPVLDELYEAILREPFLMGTNDRGWRCSFDYVWKNSNNYMKILEGGHWGRSPGKEDESRYEVVSVTTVGHRSNESKLANHATHFRNTGGNRPQA